MSAAMLVTGQQPGLQSVPFGRLALSPFNPRKSFRPEEIAALAESIAQMGVLQNLVARPEGAALGVLCGGRRWRAVAQLVAAGRAAADFPVPVNVALLDDRAALRMAVAENDQREQLHPLEQGDAYLRMQELGDTVAVIALETGRTEKFVRQRLAFCTRLSDRVRSVFGEGGIDIAQAQAFTLGDKEHQDELLPRVAGNPGYYRPEAIRAVFTEHLIPLSRAIFDPALIRGVRRDLFREEEYAEDRAEFARLQREAVERSRDELRRAGWAWVEILHGDPFFPAERFERGVAAADGGGAIVHLKDNLAVDIVTGLRRTDPRDALRDELGIKPSATALSRGPASAPRPRAAREPHPAGKPAPWPTAEFALWVRAEKSRRLREAVADSADSSLVAALAALLLLGGVPGFAGLQGRALAGRAPELAARLAEIERLAPQLALDLAGERPELVFDELRALPDFVLLALLRTLVAGTLAAWPAGLVSELGDSPLAVALAEAAGAARPPGVPGTAYLERLDLAALQRIGTTLGIAEAADAADRDTAIDALALTDELAGWIPPELTIGPADAIAAALRGDAPGGDAR